jgi:hypothetical protein
MDVLTCTRIAFLHVYIDGKREKIFEKRFGTLTPDLLELRDAL